MDGHNNFDGRDGQTYIQTLVIKLLNTDVYVGKIDISIFLPICDMYTVYITLVEGSFFLFYNNRYSGFF